MTTTDARDPGSPRSGGIKVLSLLQPWASLIAIGAKSIETRSWSTHYRGPLAIHASKGTGRWSGSSAALLAPAREAAARAGLPDGDLPRGAIVAVCELACCIRVRPEPMRASAIAGDPVITIPPPEPELLFGDYAPGRWAWVLRNIKRLDPPIPATGALGLWNWQPPQTLTLTPADTKPAQPPRKNPDPALFPSRQWPD